MAHAHIDTSSLVVLHGDDGYTVIPSPDNPLTRLHYFDGKLLRAHDLEVEQRHLRALVELANRGGGHGVVHGLDTSLGGGGASLRLGPGMAVDGSGRALLLPGSIEIGVGELIARSGDLGTTGEGGPAGAAGEFRDCPPPATEAGADASPAVDGLYLVTLAHAEALCGEEDVYGRLCEEACTTATDRPYLLEGVVLRARRLVLGAALPDSGAVALGPAHLRSRVASAYFAAEAGRVGSLISGAGLRGAGFCLGARLDDAAEVPLALLGRDGSATTFLDAWAARRERIEAPAKRYWAWRMGMRPYDAYLAMVFQFQCQLAEVLAGGGDGGPVAGDDCGEAVRGAHQIVGELARYYDGVVDLVEKLRGHGELAAELDRLAFPGGSAGIEGALAKLEASSRALSLRGARSLVAAGIVELPPAGYLPVVPGQGSVDRQVRGLLGAGVDLRYCIVRPDYVPHAFEAAQHMERISLLDGLDDPGSRPEVDILVPDGQLVDSAVGADGAGITGQLTLRHADAGFVQAAGLGRVRELSSGGFELRWVGSGAAKAIPAGQDGPDAIAAPELLAEIDPAMLEAIHRAATAARTAEASREPSTSPPPPLFYRSSAASFEMVAEPAPEAVIVGGSSTEVGAIFLRGRTDENPFDLAFGEATPALGQLVIAHPVEQGFLLDATVRADFRLENRMTAVDAMDGVSGRLVGVASLRFRPYQGELEQATETVELDAGLTIRRVDAGWAATLELRDADAGPRSDALVFDAQWNGAPVQITITGILAGEQPIVRAHARHDDEALHRPGDQRRLALRGLDLVSAVVEQRGFRDRQEAWIFGRGESARVVRATRDWVLFHRRRSKLCVNPEPRPEPQPQVRYRLVTPVYDINGTRPGATTMRFRDIGSLEFQGGTAALVTSADAIRADWRAAAPGEVITAITIATRGDREAEAVERARVRRLLEVLAGLADGGGAMIDVREDVPAVLDELGHDGVVILSARARPQQDTCHEVWWAPQRLYKGILGSDGAAVLERGATRLGEVSFRVDDHQIRAGREQIVEAYASIPAHQPFAVSVLSQDGDEEAGAEDLRSSRGHAIADALKLGAINVIADTVPWSGPGDCPAVTVIFGTTVVVEPVPEDPDTDVPVPELVVVRDLGRGRVERILDEPDLIVPFDGSGVRIDDGRARAILDRVGAAVGDAGSTRVTVVRSPDLDDGAWDERRDEITRVLRDRGIVSDDTTVEIRDALTASERRVLGERADRPLILIRVPRG